MQDALVVQEPAGSPVAFRDVATLMFRHRTLFATSFMAAVCVAILTALLLPPKYESSVKLLVQRERADIPISPERDATYGGPVEEISEAEMNSELELLKTDDILRGTVQQTGLAGRKPTPRQLDRAVYKLRNTLKIDPVNKSDIIGITYQSRDPQLSSQVLNTLVALYFQKHMELSRETGEYEFFDRQAERYKEQLAQLEKQLAAAQVVSPDLTRDKMVDKVTDLRVTTDQTGAAIAETAERIATLKALEKSTPERLVTERKTADNPQLLQNMKATLLSLQLDRDQLVAKYQPSYRPVQDLDKKIADAKAAIAREESRPMREEVTNQNTAYEWIRTELAKAEADLQGYRARQNADQHILSADNADLRQLNTSSISEQDLLREAKTAEANYLLYTQKREEARISGELDEKKILNVVVVQRANPSATHVRSRTQMVLLGSLGAIVLSFIAVLIADLFDPRFRSAHEVAVTLDMPVLATVPSSMCELMRIDN
jgi:uncharacterized protein involved in exopolysaccharide biosynthesis